MATARLPGREPELALLLEQLQRPGAALISGEAGIGKTRLVATALEGRPPLLRVAFPGSRFTEPALGLRRLLALGGPEAARLAEEIEGPEVAGGRLASIADAADALVRAHAPCALVFDDVQWADDLTLAWVSQTSQLLEDADVRLVIVVRTPDRLPARVSAAVTPLRRAGLLGTQHLGPLDLDGVRAMAGSLGYPVDGREAERLLQRSDGLPLAVEELLRTTIDAGDQEVPAAIGEIVRASIAELDDDASSLVHALALLPEESSEAMVRATIQLSPGRFDAAVEQAISSGLIVRRDRGVSFRHDLQREAARDDAPLAGRRRLHRRAAELLRAAGAPSAQVADQLLAAGERLETVASLQRAASEASAAGDDGTALAHLSAALELSDPGGAVSIVERAAVAARNVNRPQDGLRLVNVAEQRVKEPVDRGRLLLTRARLALQTGDFPGRLESLRRALSAFALAQDPLGQASALASLALPVDDLLPVAERVELGERGMRLARGVGDAMILARCAGNLAAAEISRGNARAFELWREAARAIGPELGPEAAEEYLRNLANWAIAAVSDGRSAEAAEVVTRGVGAAREVGSARWEGSFRTVGMLRLWRIGRWDVAVRESEHGLLVREADAALMDVVAGAVASERDPRPTLDRLASGTATLLRHSAWDWAAAGQAVLMRARAMRREPRPTRGLRPLLEEVVETRLGAGWEDVLPAAASVDPRAHERAARLLGDLRPSGRRAPGHLAWAEGLATSDPERLLAAAAELEDLDEPYPQALALADASVALAAAGRRSGAVAGVAAGLLAELGAKHSLAAFLRRAPRTRSLEPFRAEAGARTSWELTRREREIAELARLGYTASEAARSLGISPRTVEKHLERVKAKLGVTRKSELVRLLADG